MDYKLVVRYSVNGDSLDAEMINRSIEKLINNTFPYMVDNVVVDIINLDDEQ